MKTTTLNIVAKVHPSNGLSRRLVTIEALVAMALAEQFSDGSLSWWSWYAFAFLTLFGFWNWLGRRYARRGATA